MQKKAITPHETRSPFQYILCSPSILHLNPSMTPTIGLSAYNSRHFSGITELLNPTGETYSPNCTINGMIYRKSLYFTFSAVMYKLIPNEARKARIIKNGKNKICQDGTNRYQRNKTSINAKDIPKSTRLTITELAGMISRGK